MSVTAEQVAILRRCHELSDEEGEIVLESMRCAY